ncbi:Transcriptional enhancer factor TEF-1 [Holothuria leucospilota]|uniref:Transcriptional enhancer factor TEF-1 n=1 Tax=Holothuria leucospilota TaxID=206669 RepID=A0A9Q1H399_HOLLE|nr:Transcriptional enhancer factor TEF-1 [Holothuria leucospilota]
MATDSWSTGQSGPTTTQPPPSGAQPTTHSANSSPGMEEEMANDAEGVWSPDIEQSFQEALAIYPPCGRRKIILSDEGKMYGRNELIARYIKLRTGKTRTRKQVSSHIQVLARRKARELQAMCKVSSHIQVLAKRTSREIQKQFKQDQSAKDKALQSMAAMSSAQIVSATALQNKAAAFGLPGLGVPAAPLRPSYTGAPVSLWQPGLTQAGPSQDIKPFAGTAPQPYPPVASTVGEYASGVTPQGIPPPWEGRSIGTRKLRLVEFQAFLEHQRENDNYSKHLFVHLGSNVTYSDPLLEVSSDGRYLQAIDVRQIYDKFPEKKGGLKDLYDKGPPEAFFLVKFWADLNTTLSEDQSAFYGVSSHYESPENMTISCSTKVCSFGKQVVEKVEVVTNRDTHETLLCIAFVFEVSTSEHGAQHHIYRLVKD